MPFTVEELPRQPSCLYRDVACDGCGAALRYLGRPREDGAWESLYADDALRIDLSGGDGMAVDAVAGVEPGDFTKMFCGACARKLCEQWPTIARTFARHGSPTIGHHCAEARAFVWRSISPCCDDFCGSCGERAGHVVGRVGEDVPGEHNYSHRIVECRWCGNVAASVWRWELSEKERGRVAVLEREEEEARGRRERWRITMRALGEHAELVHVIDRAVRDAEHAARLALFGRAPASAAQEAFALASALEASFLGHVPREHEEARALLAIGAVEHRERAGDVPGALALARSIRSDGFTQATLCDIGALESRLEKHVAASHGGGAT